MPDEEGNIGRRNSDRDIGGEEEIILSAGELSNCGAEIYFNGSIKVNDAVAPGKGLGYEDRLLDVSVEDIRSPRGAAEECD